MVDTKIKINNEGVVISAGASTEKRTVKTRTQYYLLGSDYSQQE